MSQGNKFKPEMTRIRLNPEQAVLNCSCYTGFTRNRPGPYYPLVTVCNPPGSKFTTTTNTSYFTDVASS